MDRVWVKGPLGVHAQHRLTRTGCRMVLVMIPSITAGTRLMELMPLLEADHRVNVVLTVPHAGEAWHHVEEFVTSLGGLAMPWHQAQQYEWDLILTASHRHIEQVRGRMLILAHGAGNLMSRRHSRKAGSPTRPTTGLDAELLMFRGRVIPAAIALTHRSELRALRRLCPEAVPTGVLTGDICLDRMMASLPYRDAYRSALEVGADEKLVTISSTWSATSAFGRHIDLYSQLLREVHDQPVRVAAVLHPMIWAVHGALQIRLWLADAIRRGLMVIPPYEGWQATMIASDHVIGDHGSTTSYAAAIGRPTHLATFPDRDIRRGSIAAALSRFAARLDHDTPVLPQLQRADVRLTRPHGLAKVITSNPGQASKALRSTMYRLLEIPEPPWPPPVSPAVVPRPLWR